MENNIGQKIKNFRKRAGKSQFELELDIDASPGSISRIESGEVNPTKETLVKVGEALKLQDYETALLVGVDVSSTISDLINITKDLQESKDLDAVVQKAVDSIVKSMNLFGSFIVIKRDNVVQLQTFTKAWYTDMIMKIINKPPKSITAPIEEHSQNCMVQAVLQRKAIIDPDVVKFLYPAVSMPIAQMLKKLTNVKACSALPLIHDDEVVGAISFSKSYESHFEEELLILQAFADFIAGLLYKFK